MLLTIVVEGSKIKLNLLPTGTLEADKACIFAQLDPPFCCLQLSSRMKGVEHMEKQVVIPLGEHRISGVLHMPEHAAEGTLPAVVICHGFISNKVGQHRLFVKAARALSRAGFAVLRFDYVGCGESTGEYQDITLTQQAEDTIGVLNFLSTQPQIDPRRIILLGHSLGGGIASYVAGTDPRVTGLVLWSPVAKPWEDITGIVGEQLARTCLGGGDGHYQGFSLGRDFFISLSKVLPLEKVGDFTGDVLIMHGTNDVETPLTNVRLYEEALGVRPQGDVTFKLVDGADHTYNAPVWEQEVIDGTVQWLAAKYATHANILMGIENYGIDTAYASVVG